MTVNRVELVAADGVSLDAVEHPAVGTPVGAVVLAHGITVDMDEGGMFVRLAERLAGLGMRVLQFSFRGHGRSGGTSRGVTIAGECLDFQAAATYVRESYPDSPMSVVGASFGAVSAVLSLRHWQSSLRGLALWNPVLDLRHTFVAPELPWGLENFGPEQQNAMSERGFLSVDGEFALDHVLFDEFILYDPLSAFIRSRIPSLVVHGDSDTYVSYDIARSAAESRPETHMHTVRDSDHGFDSREREDKAIGATVDWLARLHGVSA